MTAKLQFPDNFPMQLHPRHGAHCHEGSKCLTYVFGHHTIFQNAVLQL